MADIRREFQMIIRAALGESNHVGVTITGNSPDTLLWSCRPGEMTGEVGNSTYTPKAPFNREIIVELLARTLKSRWSRFDPYTLSITPATEDHFRKLRASYSACKSAYEINSGWYDLLHAAFSWIHERQPGAEWQTGQIKEKWGGLRIYWHGNLDDISDQIIDAACHLSEYICEQCGAPGELRTGGWVQTLCDQHHREKKR